VSVVTDYPDFSPHVATAQQVAATGVPLLTKNTRVYQQAFTNVASGAAASTGLLAMGQIGYEVLVNARCNGAATNPFAEIRMTWTDSTTGFTLGSDTFITPMSGSATPWAVIGRGPTKADEVTVTVTNLDSLTAPSITITVLQNSRVYPTDNWNWNNASVAGLTVPGFALPTLPNDESVLGIVSNVNVAAGAVNTWLLGMATSGQVIVTTSFSGVTTTNIRCHIYPQPNSKYGSSIDLVAFTATANNTSMPYNPPRAPVILVVSNGATTGTLTGEVAVIRQP
jgi:hypothetical protein